MIALGISVVYIVVTASYSPTMTAPVPVPSNVAVTVGGVASDSSGNVDWGTMTVVWDTMQSEDGRQPIVITNNGNVAINSVTFTVRSATFPSGSVPSGSNLNLYSNQAGSGGALIESTQIDSTGVGTVTQPDEGFNLAAGATWQGYLEVLVLSANSPYTCTCSWSATFS